TRNPCIFSRPRCPPRARRRITVRRARVRCASRCGIPKGDGGRPPYALRLVRLASGSAARGAVLPAPGFGRYAPRRTERGDEARRTRETHALGHVRQAERGVREQLFGAADAP